MSTEIEDLMRGILKDEHLLARHLYQFLDNGFDPDAYFTPMEHKHRQLAIALGLDYEKLRKEALELAREYVRGGGE